MYSNIGYAQNIKSAYFAGGCFWCMEESFEKVDGVLEVISGYSGGKTKNPTYKEVTYGNSGHFEVIKIRYDIKKINYEKLLDIFWINIDPFDSTGQFCDKGYSYRSVVFYSIDTEKKLIQNTFRWTNIPTGNGRIHDWTKRAWIQTMRNRQVFIHQVGER